MPDSSVLTDLLSLREPQMVKFVRTLGWPTYRAGQILRWLYQRRARTVAQMTDLSHRDHLLLTEVAVIRRSARCRSG